MWNLYFVNSQTGYGTIERYVSGNGAVVKTTNGGMNWTRIEIPGAGVDLDPVGFINANTGWVANHGGSIGIRQTTNGGFNWTLIPVGSGIHGIFIVSDSVAYASGNQFYKYSGTTVGINGNESSAMPYKNTLNQNYPNPFNPVTTISYELIRNTNVVVEIYNSAGEFIELLAQTRQGPGTFSVEWNAEKFPSGVYFYSLRTDQGNYYGKAVFIK